VGGGLAERDVAGALEDRLLHLADGFGDADLAGQASVQLKMVRQRQYS
jgi:hypothetical protein